jgi:fido (protein-threonine AMPylation protein)
VKTQLALHSYPLDECAVRFHHRLVHIHPFPNGNGRHARLATDILLRSVGSEEFSWGRANLLVDNNLRSSYIEALRSADRGNFALLLKFVRS